MNKSSGYISICGFNKSNLDARLKTMSVITEQKINYKAIKSKNISWQTLAKTAMFVCAKTFIIMI